MLLWSVLGGAILALVLYDLVSTSFAIGSHGGPITRRISVLVWRASQRAVRRKVGRGTVVGTRVILSVVLSWMLLSWLAWFLVFLGWTPAIVLAATGEPADVFARLYYAGFTVFTLGLGDYEPRGPLWQFLTALAAGQGFFVLTLSVTYVVPVVSAVTQKRTLARAIGLLGSSPGEMVRSTWTGRDFGHLPTQLSSLASDLLTVQQQHFAYPVLHYFVAVERVASLERAVAALDQAVLLWRYGVAAHARPEHAALHGLRKAIDAYLDTRKFAQVDAREEPEDQSEEELAPRLPPLESLTAAGIPTVAPEEYHRAARQDARHRRLLDALIQHEGWSWEDVVD